MVFTCMFLSCLVPNKECHVKAAASAICPHSILHAYKRKKAYSLKADRSSNVERIRRYKEPKQHFLDDSNTTLT